MADGYDSGYDWMNPLKSLKTFGSDAGFQLGQYGQGIGDTLGGDGAFGFDSMFGGGKNGGSGWLGGATDIGLGIWQGLQAKKQFDLQSDMFDFQRDAFNKNYEGQVKNYNMNMADRYRASKGSASASNEYYNNRSVEDHLGQYGLKDPGRENYA